jgi:hypothetical protein
LAALECVRAVKGVELGGAVCNSVFGVQLAEETVGQGNPVRWPGSREGLTDDFGDVAGEDFRAVLVRYVREDWLELGFLLQTLAK